MIVKLIWVLLLLTVVFAVYVRVAPYDQGKWHVPSTRDAFGDFDTLNTFEAVRGMTAAPTDILEALELVILKDARTTRVSGAPKDKLVTYQTRSLLFGYPDYTTVSVLDGRLVSIHGRARFGKSDIGQNAKRINRWIDAMGPLLVSQ